MNTFAKYPQAPQGDFDNSPSTRRQAILASDILLTFVADWHVNTGFKFRP